MPDKYFFYDDNSQMIVTRRLLLKLQVQSIATATNGFPETDHTT